MSIDDRISDALFDYCIAWRDHASAVQDKVETELRAAIEQHVAEAVKAERLAIIKALPAGHYADPQQVADMIRDRGVDEVTL